jgi:transcriptional regulator with XRE-family HTH domain
MGTLIECSIDTMTHDEKKFFKELGARVAQLRKEQGVTQVQLGEMLGIAQQMVASYEIGRRRIPVSMIPRLAHALAMPLEALLGVSNGAAKRGPTPKLQQQMERIHRLPKARQKFVMEMLETVLQQTSR